MRLSNKHFQSRQLSYKYISVIDRDNLCHSSSFVLSRGTTPYTKWNLLQRTQSNPWKHLGRLFNVWSPAFAAKWSGRIWKLKLKKTDAGGSFEFFSNNVDLLCTAFRESGKVIQCFVVRKEHTTVKYTTTLDSSHLRCRKSMRRTHKSCAILSKSTCIQCRHPHHNEASNPCPAKLLKEKCSRPVRGVVPKQPYLVTKLLMWSWYFASLAEGGADWARLVWLVAKLLIACRCCRQPLIH